MTQDMTHEQFVLRVKYGAELDTALRALDENGKLTEAELQDICGLSRTPWLMRQLPKWFDNIHVHTQHGDETKAMELSYTEIMPGRVNVVTSDVNFNSTKEVSTPHNDPGTMDVPIKWPLAPPLIDEMENFDEPSWFGLMDQMVRKGRHISLESAPGLGKDTAVQQLAAQRGRPLVTIGGDGGFRRRDLVGSPQISNGTSFFEVAEYAAAAVNGWWVLITEVNAADPDALMYINAQLAPPYIVMINGKAYPRHPDFRLFVSYNAGLVGTKPLPPAFKDRFFSFKIPFFSRYQLGRRLAAMGMRDDGESFSEIILSFGMEMNEAQSRGRMRYQVTTRRLIDAAILCQELEYPAKEALEMAVINAIDSPVEQKAAESVLASVIESHKLDR